MPGSRLLITGANGLLGTAVILAARRRGFGIIAVCGRHPIPVEEADVMQFSVDLAEPGGALPKQIDRLRPDIVFHAAAITDVDWCETHPVEAKRVNALVPGEVAEAAKRVRARFAYISTDAVFDGRGSLYSESDVAKPVNVYARCKLEGEERTCEVHPGALIVRTNLFGTHPARRGLAEWMLGRLAQAQPVPAWDDVMFSPLLADDLAATVLDMLEANLRGLFHVAASDSSSKFEFGRRLAAKFGYRASLVERSSLASASLVAPRPANTTLSVVKVTEALGRSMPTVDEGLEHFRNSRA